MSGQTFKMIYASPNRIGKATAQAMDLAARTREYTNIEISVVPHKDLADAKARIEALETVVEAARSVASEPDVADLLSCYNMGVELVNRLAKLDGREGDECTSR